MKKVLLFFSIVMVSISLVGCKQYIKGRTEIDKLSFVRIVGFDKGENEDVIVTVASKNVTTQDGKSGSQKNTASISSAKGRTVFEAIRKLSLYSDRRPFFGHTEFILIGEELAKKGILPYIDFFTRDHELRINSKVYLVKDITAQELLEKSSASEQFVADRLGNLESASGAMSVSSDVPLVEVMFILDNPYLSLYIPFIQVLKTTKRSEEESVKFDISLRGYAIFKDSKMVGHLEMYEARGLNWLRNLIDSGIIVVKGKAGENISLEIIKSQCKIKPIIYSNGDLKATVKVELDTNIGEILGTKGVFTKEDLDYIQRQQEEEVKQEIMSAIKFAKNNKMDFFSLGTQFFQKYPAIWENYEKNWGERVPAINFDVQVKSNIMRTYLLRDPTSKEGD